eukprot:23268_1
MSLFTESDTKRECVKIHKKLCKDHTTERDVRKTLSPEDDLFPIIKTEYADAEIAGILPSLEVLCPGVLSSPKPKPRPQLKTESMATDGWNRIRLSPEENPNQEIVLKFRQKTVKIKYFLTQRSPACDGKKPEMNFTAWAKGKPAAESKGWRYEIAPGIFFSISYLSNDDDKPTDWHLMWGPWYSTTKRGGFVEGLRFPVVMRADVKYFYKLEGDGLAVYPKPEHDEIRALREQNARLRQKIQELETHIVLFPRQVSSGSDSIGNLGNVANQCEMFEQKDSDECYSDLKYSSHSNKRPRLPESESSQDSCAQDLEDSEVDTIMGCTSSTSTSDSPVDNCEPTYPTNMFGLFEPVTSSDFQIPPLTGSFYRPAVVRSDRETTHE